MLAIVRSALLLVFLLLLTTGAGACCWCRRTPLVCCEYPATAPPKSKADTVKSPSADIATPPPGSARETATPPPRSTGTAPSNDPNGIQQQIDYWNAVLNPAKGTVLHTTPPIQVGDRRIVVEVRLAYGGPVGPVTPPPGDLVSQLQAAYTADPAPPAELKQTKDDIRKALVRVYQNIAAAVAAGSYLKGQEQTAVDTGEQVGQVITYYQNQNVPPATLSGTRKAIANYYATKMPLRPADQLDVAKRKQLASFFLDVAGALDKLK